MKDILKTINEPNDSSTNLQQLKDIMNEFVVERKWSKYHQPKELAQAICIEAAELLELFLWSNPDIKAIKEDVELMSALKEEIADVFAYMLSMINSLNIDLTSVFLSKMEKNRKKYPKEFYRKKEEENEKKLKDLTDPDKNKANYSNLKPPYRKY
ncbi:MAG: nucleotide pyrophosphohydrolase [Promethearchaeota archaeon]